MSTATLKPGTRVNASAYTGQHGTITGEHHREPAYQHAITGDPMPETVWYDVRLDNGTRELLDASRFTLADGFDCASCAAREPMPGTFGAWLGGRTAEHVPYRRETDPPSADPFTTPSRRVAPSLGDQRPMADRVGASTSSVQLRDLYRRMLTTPSGQPKDAEHGPGPSGKFRASWAAIGGADARTSVEVALAERYPETLRSLATDLAHHGQTVADVLRIEHVRPGGRRIVVYMSDGCAYRAYALDGEGSCGVCSGRGADPHEPGLPCVACEGSCEPSDARLDDRAADHA